MTSFLFAQLQAYAKALTLTFIKTKPKPHKHTIPGIDIAYSIKLLKESSLKNSEAKNSTNPSSLI